MRKIIYLGIIRRLLLQPESRRKVKFIALLAAFVLTVSGIGVLYVGWWGLNYASNLAKGMDFSHLEKSATQYLNMPTKYLGPECVVVAKDVLRFESLVGTPLMDNWNQLKKACVQDPSGNATHSEELKNI